MGQGRAKSAADLARRQADRMTDRQLRAPGRGCPLVSRRFGHQLDQHAARILRVDEDHRHAVRADAGLAGAEHGRTSRAHRVARGDDVGHLEADMMLAAGRELLQEAPYRRRFAQRLDQLELAVGEIDERHRHALLGQRELGDADGRAVQPLVHRQRRVDIRSRDPDVVQPPDLHANASSNASIVPTTVSAPAAYSSCGS